MSGAPPALRALAPHFKADTPAGSFSRLLEIVKAACDHLAPVVLDIYHRIPTQDSSVKQKADSSEFTLADGLVQDILQTYLFRGGSGADRSDGAPPSLFKAVVGEEDESNINLITRPFMIDSLPVPPEFFDRVDELRENVKMLATAIDPVAYQDCTIFIDPIDGTKEFSTGRGEECTILVGIARQGVPVAGLVYRPVSRPQTWAAGCAAEGLFVGELDFRPSEPKWDGILATNGALTAFNSALAEELGFEFVRAGGAGNKLLSVIEGKGSCYISDRGVSRWDTCAPQAVCDAAGGTLAKLDTFIAEGRLASYTYEKTDVNLDFTPGQVHLSKYNKRPDESSSSGLVATAAQLKPYANVCGLMALGPIALPKLELFLGACRAANTRAPVEYN